jgi:hypothetical protein
MRIKDGINLAIGFTIVNVSVKLLAYLAAIAVLVLTGESD